MPRLFRWIVMRGLPRKSGEEDERDEVDGQERGNGPLDDARRLHGACDRESDRGRGHPRGVPPADGVAHVPAVAARDEVVLHDRPLQRPERGHGDRGEPQRRRLREDEEQRGEDALREEHHGERAARAREALEPSHGDARGHCDRRVEHAVQEREEKALSLREAVLALRDEVERIPEDSRAERAEEGERCDRKRGRGRLGELCTRPVGLGKVRVGLGHGRRV